jgi:ketosteroid isomerase-like protein
MHSRFAMGAVVLAVVVGIAACSAPKPQEFGKPDIDAIRQGIQDFVAAFNAKDAAKASLHFSGNGILMPPNRSTLHGQEPIKGFYDGRFAEGATGLEIDAKEVTGNGSLAYAHGSFSLTVKGADGSEQRDRGKILWILRNYAGKWLFEVQIWNSDLPPPVPPAPPSADEAKKTPAGGN